MSNLTCLNRAPLVHLIDKNVKWNQASDQVSSAEHELVLHAPQV